MSISPNQYMRCSYCVCNIFPLFLCIIQICHLISIFAKTKSFNLHLKQTVHTVVFRFLLLFYLQTYFHMLKYIWSNRLIENLQAYDRESGICNRCWMLYIQRILNVATDTHLYIRVCHITVASFLFWL